MFNNARRRFLSLFGKTAAATAVVGATGAASLAQAAPTDDELRRMASARLMYSSTLDNQPFGLKSMGYDWKLEQQRMAEEAEAQAEIQASIQAQRQLDIDYLNELEARLLADCPNYFGPAIEIPFASLPTGTKGCRTLYLRTPTEAYDNDLRLSHLLDDIRDGFTKRIEEMAAALYEHRLLTLYAGTKAPAGSPPVEMVARLNKYQHAGRFWSSRYIIDIDELTPAKIGSAIIGVVRGLIDENRKKLDEACARCPDRVVEFFRSAPLKTRIKLDGPMVEIEAYAETAGQLKKISEQI